MKRVVCAAAVIMVLGMPIAASAADIGGTVTRQGGGAITNADVFLLDVDGYYLGPGTPVDGSGNYSLTNISEGDYKIEVRTYTGSADQYYAVARQSVTVAASNPPLDFELEPGGNISGTVTTEAVPSDWANLQAGIHDIDGNWITFGEVQSDGTFITHSVPPGTYYIRFSDFGNEFQQEWYGNYPDFYYYGDTDPVVISAGSTTAGIDASLHQIADAKERYYFSYPWVTTAYIYSFITDSINTHADAGADINRMSDGASVSPDLVSSFAVTPPTGSCTDSRVENSTVSRLYFRDRNGDQLIDLNSTQENLGWRVALWTSAYCQLGSAPHATGSYTLQASFANGESISKTIEGQTPYTVADLPPVENLNASWDNTANELTISWQIPTPPTIYPSEILFEIRITTYQNGHWRHDQLRIRDLPGNTTTFTLPDDMTTHFNHGDVDQIMIEIRTRGSVSTRSVIRQSYNFNFAAGTLEEYPIAMKLLDVNGDQRTGLEEAIYSLRAVTID